MREHPAPIGNKARADAALAIHADADHPVGTACDTRPELMRAASTDNGPVIGLSHRLADAMVRHFAAVTSQNVSTTSGCVCTGHFAVPEFTAAEWLR